MITFKPVGPIRLPFSKKGHAKRIGEKDLEKLKKEKTYKKIAKRKGCYIFCIQHRKGIVPAYIGKTEKTFEKECFHPHKTEKYNEYLFNNTKIVGQPVMYFLLAPVKKGPPSGKIINDLEGALIKYCHRINPKLSNENKLPLKKWAIKGFRGSGKGKISDPSKSLQKMLGLESGDL